MGLDARRQNVKLEMFFLSVRPVLSSSLPILISVIVSHSLLYVLSYIVVVRLPFDLVIQSQLHVHLII